MLSSYMSVWNLLFAISLVSSPLFGQTWLLKFNYAYRMRLMLYYGVVPSAFICMSFVQAEVRRGTVKIRWWWWWWWWVSDDWQLLWSVDLCPALFCGQFMFHMLQATAKISCERPRRSFKPFKKSMIKKINKLNQCINTAASALIPTYILSK